MTCPKCGAKIADNAVMCPRCNSFMDDKPSSSNTQRTTSGNRSYTTPYTTAKPQKTGSGKKKSTALLIAAILGVLYALYSIFYWAGAASGSSGAEAIGAATGQSEIHFDPYGIYKDYYSMFLPLFNRDYPDGKSRG